MNLFIDIGNTSIHWRLSDGLEKASPSISVRHKDKWESALGTVQSTLGNSSVENIVVASVAGEQAQESVKNWAKTVLSLSPKFVKSQKQFSSVSNAYDVPESLGVDRWLAILAGHNIIIDDKSDAALIVDAGTAMTLDAVLINGEHLGGNIIAGLELQQKNLLKNTSLIDESNGEASVWGVSTASAVANGAQLALLGAITLSYEQLKLNLGPNSRIHLMLTGGDAETLEQFFAERNDILFSVHSNLVLDGLEVYLASSN